LIETELVRALQSMGDRAEQLSLFAAYLGDPALVNEQLSRYRAVTPDRVNAIIADRLGPDNRLTLLYVPRREAADEMQGSAA
jgi:predicted Zn-dependent peptidase